MVNDVFLKAFTSIEGFVGNEAQFNAWMFRIARNQLIDNARYASRRPVEVHAGLRVLSGSAQDGPEENVVARLSPNSIMAHLEILTHEQREVVLLRIVSDLTVDAVAEVLGKQPGTIKALQRRAFRRLASSMTESGAVRLEAAG